MTFIERSAEEKKILWSENGNRYLLLEEHAYEVMARLIAGVPSDQIVQWCKESYGLPVRESRRFVKEVGDMFGQLMATEPVEISTSDQQVGPDADRFAETKHYQVNDWLIRVDYENDRLKTLIHPKFAHLESALQSAEHFFQLFEEDQDIVLVFNGIIMGKWKRDMAHLLIGRFFIELLNLMYQKTEEEWMAVFHASGLSNGNQAILFTGESGSGKTTLCAVLMAQGYQLVSDDLVPVDARLQEAFCFPAALSIKEKALDLLLPTFPELNSADEFHYPALNKTVRYLKPGNSLAEASKSWPCKAIVFVNYQLGSGLRLEKMPAYIAFQHLIPDSWISPVAQNAEKFLDWFLAMPCYQLTYSDTETMVAAINQLFEDDSF